jgi:hypothetical protein
MFGSGPIPVKCRLRAGVSDDSNRILWEGYLRLSNSTVNRLTSSALVNLRSICSLPTIASIRLTSEGLSARCPAVSHVPIPLVISIGISLLLRLQSGCVRNQPAILNWYGA